MNPLAAVRPRTHLLQLLVVQGWELPNQHANLERGASHLVQSTRPASAHVITSSPSSHCPSGYRFRAHIYLCCRSLSQIWYIISGLLY